MPTNNQNLPEDHLIIEISSGVNSAIHSAINDAIGKAHPAIKVGLLPSFPRCAWECFFG